MATICKPAEKALAAAPLPLKNLIALDQSF
jgi:hypothetical protein